jgi:hypothetical protein
MMSYTVTMPDPATQYRKTPAWVRVFKEVLDEQGQPIKIAVKRFFMEGTGEDMRVFRWHEAVDRVRDYVENHTLVELKQVFEKITGEPYEGTQSKKGVLKAVLVFWFGFDQDLTMSEMKAWALNHLKNNVGEWGLGCPNGCGRYWAFKVVGGKFMFKDRAAWTGTQAEVLDEWDDTNPETGATTHYYRIRHWEGDVQIVTEVPMNRGYLEAYPQEQRFTCDRCGATITLSE